MKSKINRKFIWCLMGVLILIFSCSPEAEPELQVKYSRDYWGEWLNLSNEKNYSIADKIYIAGDQIYIGSTPVSKALGYGGYSTVNKFTLTSLSDNVKVISYRRSVSDPDYELYLFANRIKNGSFSGTIADFDSHNRSVQSVAGGRGWGNVVISDLLDLFNNHLNPSVIINKAANQGHS